MTSLTYESFAQMKFFGLVDILFTWYELKKTRGNYKCSNKPVSYAVCTLREKCPHFEKEFYIYHARLLKCDERYQPTAEMLED